MPEQDVEAYLRSIQTNDRVRAAAWDAVYAGDDAKIQQQLSQLPVPENVKADLWEMAHGTYRPAQAGLMERAGQAMGDVATGAVKGLGNTVVGLGEMVHLLPGVTRAVDALYGTPGLSQQAFAEGREMMRPTNTAQQIGQTAEQIGEFFLPVGAAGKAGRVAEVGKSAALTMAQGGTSGEAAASGALTAAMPAVARGVGNVASSAAGRFRRGAEKTVAQALGATKEGMKTEAARIAPEMLKRGVRGSRASMLEQARSQVSEVGAKIGAEVQAAAKAGQTVSGQQIRGAIQLARDGLMVTDEAGQRVAIPETERVIRKLTNLDTFVESLGDDIPFDKAQKIKQTWDKVVSKAGLFTNKATASATDNAAAWSVREASTAFRDLLAKGSPTLDDLNREYAFWKGLRTVLAETERRTQAQGGGLVSGITGAAGVGAGLASGDSLQDKIQNAVIGGVAGRQLVRAMQSPWWRTTASGPAKQKLADALASGVPERIQSAIGRIAASVPAQVRTAGATQ